MELFLGFVGAIFLLVLGSVFSWWMKTFIPWGKSEPPEGIDKDDWLRTVSGPGPGATYIGRLEALFVYLAVLYARDEAGLLVAGWLAFKVASKWEMWTNVVRMPDSFEGASALAGLGARRKLGYVMYDRFLIGTLGNVMSGGIVAALVTRFSDPILQWTLVTMSCVNDVSSLGQ